MNLIKHVIVILILLLNLFVFSQNNIENEETEINSLLKELKESNYDDKAKYLNKIANAYLDISYEEALIYANKALVISQDEEDYKEEANAYINIANVAWYTGINDSVYYYYNLSLQVYKDNNDSSGIADSYNRLALVDAHVGEYDKAIDLMVKALAIYRKSRNRIGEANIQNNIGIIYDNIKQHTDALMHYRNARIIFKALGNQLEEANTINNIGSVYYALGEIDSSIVMILNSVSIFEKLSEKKSLASAYSNLGILYSEKEAHQKSDKYFEAALNLQKEIQNQYGISNVEKEIADKCFKRKQYRKAILYYKLSIDIKLVIDDKKGLSQIYEALSMLYDTIYNYKEALKYHKLYVESWQKVFSIEKEEQIAEFTTKYKTEEKIKENVILQKEIADKKREQWVLSLITITLLFISSISIISIRLKTKLLKQNKLNYRQKEELSQLNIKNKESENKRLLAESKQKEIEKMLLEDDVITQQKINELQKRTHKLDIEHKNKELITSTMHLLNKKQVLSDIKRLVEKEYDSAKVEKNNLRKIIIEINSNINLDNEWDDFKMHFEEVNNGFFSKLQSNYPKLTKNDFKLCAYMRMNLSSKEIAQILNITLSAVSKSRNRLRKKMDLDSTVKLTQFMMDL